MSEKLSDEDLIGQLISHAHTFGDFVLETNQYASELLRRLQERRASDAVTSESKQKEGSEPEINAWYAIRKFDGQGREELVVRQFLENVGWWYSKDITVDWIQKLDFSRQSPSTDAGREWISVSEKYPDRNINVLCRLKSKSGFIAPMVGKLRNNGRFSCEIYENELPIVVVTHWQEIKLPQPPRD